MSNYHDSQLTRRRVLGAGAAALALAGSAPAAGRKRILILGGTGYLGPATVETAQARGHELTLFNRGKTRPGLFPNIAKLEGDRDPDKGAGLKALEKGEWDVVIDNSAYYPRQVTASAKLLAPRAKQYIIISSISVYSVNDKEGLDETAPLEKVKDPEVENLQDLSRYGGLKAACEQAAEAAMPGRTTIVRPGFIVGPDDPSGRFTYWPVRLDRGGDVLTPGAPTDPVQFVDVRDLGAWLVTLAENGTMGTFNATGPRERLKWGDFLKACQGAASQPSTLVWVPPKFLREQKVQFPIWAPYEGDTLGFHTWSIARALKAGLKFRPYAQTVKDTLAWYKTQGADGRNRLAGPKPEREAEVLAAWKKQQPAG